MINRNFRTQWEELREAVDEIELQIARSALPIPTELVCRLLVAGEDRRFYMHPGVDPIAFCRAFWKTYFCGFRQGASTIAMQIVRTITGRYEKTWRRKFDEIILAIRLTRYTDKKRLPVLYLWVAYYGAGMGNFQQACMKLKIDQSKATSLELAELVARLKYPEPRKYNRSRSQQILNRARYLLVLNYRSHKSQWSRMHRSHGAI